MLKHKVVATHELAFCFIKYLQPAGNHPVERLIHEVEQQEDLAFVLIENHELLLSKIKIFSQLIDHDQVDFEFFDAVLVNFDSLQHEVQRVKLVVVEYDFALSSFQVSRLAEVMTL